MEFPNTNTVVLDHGTHTVKAGFAGQDEPTVVMRSLVGRPKGENDREVDTNDVYLGEEALARKEMLRLKYPVEWGFVVNWTDAEIVWKHIFENELDSNMSECPLLMSEPSPSPPSDRERFVQNAFETLKVPAFYLASASALALGGAGHTTGLVVDIGRGQVRVVPVYESHYLQYWTFRFQMSGGDLTQVLLTMLAQRESSPQKFDFETVRDMKEKYAYVAQDFEKEMQSFDSSKEKQYHLSTGGSVTLGKEQFQCAETLFRPAIAGYEIPGLAEHICHTISRCDASIREEIARKILLTGGGSLLPGLQERLQHDVQVKLDDSGSKDLKVQVLAPQGRELLVWKGGSLLASSSAFPGICITPAEYDEYGPMIVHRKCF